MQMIAWITLQVYSQEIQIEQLTVPMHAELAWNPFVSAINEKTSSHTTSEAKIRSQNQVFDLLNFDHFIL